MEQKLLTIAIPTYNRRDYIEESLNSILQQYDDRIELIVMDNCSPDNTAEFMAEKVDRYPFIKYIRNKENIGPDGNFLKCLRTATGKYVHLLSDDDILEKNSLRNILNLLSGKKEFAIVEINYNYFIKSTAEIENSKYTYEGDEPIVFNKNQFGQMVEKIYINLTFLSTMIFNKKMFDKIQNPEQYKFTNLLQTHLLFLTMGQGDNCAILPTAVVYARGGNGSGYNPYQIFIKNWKDVLFTTAKNIGIPVKSLNIAFNKTLTGYMSSWILGLRRKEIINFPVKPKWRYLLSAIRFKQAWLRLYPIVILPLPVIDFLQKLRHKT